MFERKALLHGLYDTFMNSSFAILTAAFYEYFQSFVIRNILDYSIYAIACWVMAVLIQSRYERANNE